jgi:squalene synthase HpnC
VSRADAYAACARLAAEHYENFPVASRLVPARMRPHIAAVYAFARTADDFADEDGYTLAERHLRLDDWRARLRASAGIAGADVPAPPARHDPEAARVNAVNVGPGPQFRRTALIDPDLVFEALAHTIETCALDVSLFEDLLSAFRQDTVVKRYATWDDVLDYCRRSANPVGRLVLRIAGYRDAALDESSDALCTALQLTNFWQDLAVDWRRGRLYVPLAVRDAAGAADADLDAARLTPAWHAALAAAASRTRELFDRGRPVCDGVHGRLRYELRLTWLGATTVLEKLQASGFDVFRHRPSLGAGDGPALAWRLLLWRQGGRT